MTEPYDWLSTNNYTRHSINNLHIYNPDYKRQKYVWQSFQHKHSSSEYTDDLYIHAIVCNKRYVFILMKKGPGYDVDMYNLFVIDTENLNIDDYKFFDILNVCDSDSDSDSELDKTDLDKKLKEYKFDNCWFRPTKNLKYTLDKISKTSKTMSCIPIYEHLHLKLYCNQDSNLDECILVSDDNIYLYKNDQVYKHSYLYTIRGLDIQDSFVVFQDEYKIQYKYTFDNNDVYTTVHGYKCHSNHDYTIYNNTRLDIKGTSYRCTLVLPPNPKYHLLSSCNSNCCYSLSENICVIQTFNHNLDLLVRNK